MLDNTYKEIVDSSSGLYKEKGSKFIAYCYPIYSKEEAKIKIEKVKKIEYAARHYCYAYILYADKSSQRANDDGEPSYTAGKPILGQILSNNLTNTLIVVARYFGGIKLGVPGLINAYKKAAADAISKSNIITKSVREQYEVNFRYPQINDVMRIIKRHDIEILNTDLEIKCKIIFAVTKNKEKLIIDSFEKEHELRIKHIKHI